MCTVRLVTELTHFIPITKKKTTNMQTYLFLKHKLTLVGGGEYFFCACQEIVYDNMAHVVRTISPRAHENTLGWGAENINI